jgi:hypothetical protein
MVRNENLSVFLLSEIVWNGIPSIFIFQEWFGTKLQLYEMGPSFFILRGMARDGILSWKSETDEIQSERIKISVCCVSRNNFFLRK